MRGTKEMNKGITLIALIVTIIVLLILAGVTIATLTGENGLLSRAHRASEESKKAEALEYMKLKVMEVQTEKQGNATLEDLVEYLKNDTSVTYTISLNKTSSIDGTLPEGIAEAEKIYVTYNGFEFEITENLNVTIVGGTISNNSGDSNSQSGSSQNNDSSQIQTVTIKPFGVDIAPEGEGTENSPYIITTKEQLYLLAVLVNSGNSFEGKYIKLGNDIELNSKIQWIPIGYNNTRFQGTFDGDGKTISGLNINTSSQYAGFFKYIGNLGTLKKLTLQGNITTTSRDAGGLCVYNYGTIENCINNVTINATGSNMYRFGGVVTDNYGTIKKCANIANITGYSAVGGIVSTNCGTVQSCYNSGNISATYVAGGISNSNGEGNNKFGYIFNCYNTGTITGNTTGGIAGNMGVDSGKGYIYNSYSTTSVIVGTSENSSVSENNYTSNITSKVNELNAGIDEAGATQSTESPWEADSTTNPINGGYPILSWQK